MKSNLKTWFIHKTDQPYSNILDKTMKEVVSLISKANILKGNLKVINRNKQCIQQSIIVCTLPHS